MSFNDDVYILTAGSPQYDAFQWLASYPYLFSNFTNERIIQRFALASLFYSLDGKNWSNNRDWLSESNECAWFTSASSSLSPGDDASACDANNAYVNLNLGNNSLAGSIPSEVALLTGLEYLNLRGGPERRIGSTIPTVLSLLSSLQQLDLSGNRLEGTIPEDIDLLLSLKQLNFESNELTGQLPSGMNQLSTLGSLNLAENRLTGSLASSIGNLRLLQHLSLRNNSLTGPIPSSIGALTNIEHLDLSSNRLVGALPDELGQLQNASTIKIHNNDISGTVSDRICDAFVSFTPIFYADCRASETLANPIELACPVGSCCTFCCNDEAGCQCVYENSRFDFICTLGEAYR
jgi:Leucine-rich repeat (LRR) protein